jgi:hypothetical protein
MNHSARAGLLALAGSILATIAYVEAQPLLQFLGGSGLPTWLTGARIFLIPLITMAAAWAVTTCSPATPTRRSRPASKNRGSRGPRPRLEVWRRHPPLQSNPVSRTRRSRRRRRPRKRFPLPSRGRGLGG